MNKILAVILLLIVLGGGYYIYDRKIAPINIPPNSQETVGQENPTDTEKENPSQSVSGLTIPSGFSLSVFAKNVKGARVIEFDPKGRLVVSETSEGKIVALEDTNNDHTADKQTVLATGLNNPHGLAFRCDAGGACMLYVAESNQLVRYAYDETGPSLGAKEKLIDIASSKDDRHFTRSLLFMPAPNENTLLISAGSSCDVCEEKDTDHASIISYNIVTKKKEQYAKGLRNAVFMTLNPVSGKVFATEMGRDNLGDNIPPDEINIIEKGKNYGWPICYGKNVHDTQFDTKTYIQDPCKTASASFVDLPAHSAPLGLSFIPEEGWAEDMWYNLLVSYHGSWNRSVPTGYKIVRLKMNAKGEYLGTEDFITGWLKGDGTKAGRPADIKVLSGGVIYISDDNAGVIYRLARTAQ